MVLADLYLDGRHVRSVRLVHRPAVGDVLRLGRGFLVRITEVVWCVDDEHSGHVIVRTEAVRL